MMPSSRCRTSTRWICSRRDRTRGLMRGSLPVPGFEQLDARLKPVRVFAQLVDALHEFFGLGAARHVAAFFLQILRDVLHQRVVRAPRKAECRACSVADLMSRDVADDA